MRLKKRRSKPKYQQQREIYQITRKSAFLSALARAPQIAAKSKPDHPRDPLIWKVPTAPPFSSREAHFVSFPCGPFIHHQTDPEPGNEKDKKTPLRS